MSGSTNTVDGERGFGSYDVPGGASRRDNERKAKPDPKKKNYKRLKPKRGKKK